MIWKWVKSSIESMCMKLNGLSLYICVVALLPCARAAIQMNSCNEPNQIGWSTDRQNKKQVMKFPQWSHANHWTAPEETFEKQTQNKKQRVAKMKTQEYHAYQVCVCVCLNAILFASFHYFSSGTQNICNEKSVTWNWFNTKMGMCASRQATHINNIQLKMTIIKSTAKFSQTKNNWVFI